jgi:hypothetical protein
MKDLDFLPAAYRLAARRRRRRRQMLLMSAAVLLLLAGVHTVRISRLSIAADNSTQTSTTPADSRETGRETNRAYPGAQETIPQDRCPADSPAAKVISLVRTLNGDTIVLRSLELVSGSASADVDLQDDSCLTPSVEALFRLSEVEPVKVRITGLTTGVADIGTFVDRLSACPYVVYVQQSILNNVILRGKNMKSFLVTLDLSGQPPNK